MSDDEFTFVTMSDHPNFGEGLRFQDIELTASNAIQCIAITNDSKILINKFPNTDFLPVTVNGLLNVKITAVCVSTDSNLCAFGYQNGIVALVNLISKETITTLKRSDEHEIRFISFTQNNDGIIITNNQGDLSVLIVTKMGSTVLKETRVPTNNLFCTKGFMRNVKSNYIIIVTNDSVILSFFNATSLSPIYQNTGTSIKVEYYQAGDETQIIVQANNSLMYVSVDPNGGWKINQYISLKNKIKYMRRIDRTVIAVIYEDNSFQLVFEEAKSEVFKNNSISELLETDPIVFSSMHTLYLISENAYSMIRFYNWREISQQYKSKFQFYKCFELCRSVYKSANLRYLGVNPIPQKRIEEVQMQLSQLLTSIMTKRVEMCVLVEGIRAAIDCECVDFVKTTGFEFAQSHGFMLEYITLLLKHPHAERFITYEMFDAAEEFHKAEKAKKEERVKEGVENPKPRFQNRKVTIMPNSITPKSILKDSSENLPIARRDSHPTFDPNALSGDRSGIKLERRDSRTYFENMEKIAQDGYTLSRTQSNGWFYTRKNNRNQLSSIDLLSIALTQCHALPFFADRALRFALAMDLKSVCIKIWLDVYGDIISPAAFLFASNSELEDGGSDNQFTGFIDAVLLSPNSDKSTAKPAFLWIVIPEGNRFPRLERILAAPDARTAELLDALFKLAPISLRNGDTVSEVAFLDAVVRSLPYIPYESAALVIPVIAPRIISTSYRIPPKSIDVMMRWCFAAKTALPQREGLFLRIQRQNPDKIIISELLDFCEAAGFLTPISEICLPKKDFSRIIKTMASTPDHRPDILPFIVDHINDTPEIETAVAENFQCIILLDTALALELIVTRFPAIHDRFTSSSYSHPFVRYTYITKILHDPRFNRRIKPAVISEYFRLVCQFAPSDALPLLRERKEINLRDALRSATDFHVVDACAHINSMLGDPASAVRVVATELEFQLCRAATMKEPIHATSVDTVGDVPELAKPYRIVNIGFDILDRSPQVGQTLEKMWRTVFRAFQLPLYMMKSAHRETQNSIVLFFAYFVVEAIPRLSPDFVLDTLRQEFSSLDQHFYRAILQSVVSYLNRRGLLDRSVEELLLHDCLDLLDRAKDIIAGGRLVFTPVCDACGLIINGANGVSSVVFECGHVFHASTECGRRLRCPKCHPRDLGDERERAARALAGASRGNSRRNRAERKAQRKLERVEFGLRRDFGADAAPHARGSELFFVGDSPRVPTRKRKLNVASEMPIPNRVYLEI